MSLRDRVKEILKKYGFTAFAVLSAVGVVTGVVSGLKGGLSTLGKGLGNGLKTIGKKIAEILPGMVENWSSSRTRNYSKQVINAKNSYVIGDLEDEAIFVYCNLVDPHYSYNISAKGKVSFITCCFS